MTKLSFDKEASASIATSEVYAGMLNRTKAGKFAYPAINVTSSQTVTTAIQGFAEAEFDDIIRISVGGAEHASDSTIKNRVTDSLAFITYATEVARSYGVTIALHTDHYAKQNIDSWIRPFMEIEAGQIAKGGLPTLQSHMWDGSAMPLDENLEIAKEMLGLSAKVNTILEVKIGVVGGEEDDVVGEINEKLHTTTEDALKTVEALGTGEKGYYLTALTFDDVHGVYKPGHVGLRPEILGTIQEEVAAKIGWKDSHPFNLVVHGGSGSTVDEIALAAANDIIKMNVGTNIRYALTRPVMEYVFRDYDGVLKINGEVGNEKMYGLRSWGKSAKAGMATRVVRAYWRLGSVGTKMA